MKTGIICVLAFIALTNGQEEHGETDVRSNTETKHQVCIPRSTRMEDCNSCFCLEDGSGWACTLMGCDAVFPTGGIGKGSRPYVRIGRDVTGVQSNTDTESDNCVPGTHKMLDCNRCICLENNLGWACTLMGCGTVFKTDGNIGGLNEAKPSEGIVRGEAQV